MATTEPASRSAHKSSAAAERVVPSLAEIEAGAKDQGGPLLFLPGVPGAAEYDGGFNAPILWNSNFS